MKDALKYVCYTQESNEMFGFHLRAIDLRLFPMRFEINNTVCGFIYITEHTAHLIFKLKNRMINTSL